jgi:hypothetical protein
MQSICFNHIINIKLFLYNSNMENFNVVNTLDTNDENNSETSENSESSENDNLNTIMNELSNYSENVFQTLMVCSSITLISVLCFSLLFILFISLLYLF